MVKIFFYTSTPYKFGREITCTLALCVVNSFQFHSVYNQKQFKQMLHDEVETTSILILAAVTHKELEELIILRKIHRDFPIILLLPDDSEETMHLAHKFRPKFLTTIYHDFAYVLSVVEKLSEAFCQQHPIEKIHMA